MINSTATREAMTSQDVIAKETRSFLKSTMLAMSIVVVIVLLALGVVKFLDVRVANDLLSKLRPKTIQLYRDLHSAPITIPNPPPWESTTLRPEWIDEMQRIGWLLCTEDGVTSSSRSGLSTPVISRTGAALPGSHLPDTPSPTVWDSIRRSMLFGVWSGQAVIFGTRHPKNLPWHAADHIVEPPRTTDFSVYVGNPIEDDPISLVLIGGFGLAMIAQAEGNGEATYDFLPEMIELVRMPYSSSIYEQVIGIKRTNAVAHCWSLFLRDATDEDDLRRAIKALDRNIEEIEQVADISPFIWHIAKYPNSLGMNNLSPGDVMDLRQLPDGWYEDPNPSRAVLRYLGVPNVGFISSAVRFPETAKVLRFYRLTGSLPAEATTLVHGDLLTAHLAMLRLFKISLMTRLHDLNPAEPGVRGPIPPALGSLFIDPLAPFPGTPFNWNRSDGYWFSVGSDGNPGAPPTGLSDNIVIFPAPLLRDDEMTSGILSTKAFLRRYEALDLPPAWTNP